MEVGDVFVWKNFPYPKHGNIKDRWFVFLGHTRFPDTPIFAFISTVTTQIQHYEKSGDRATHLFKKFKKGDFGFPEDCILDLDTIYDNIKLDKLTASPDTEIKGKIDTPTLKEIYSLLVLSQKISRKVKCYIYESFNYAGITGLKKP